MNFLSKLKGPDISVDLTKYNLADPVFQNKLAKVTDEVLNEMYIQAKFEIDPALRADFLKNAVNMAYLKIITEEAGFQISDLGDLTATYPSPTPNNQVAETLGAILNGSSTTTSTLLEKVQTLLSVPITTGSPLTIYDTPIIKETQKSEEISEQVEYAKHTLSSNHIRYCISLVLRSLKFSNPTDTKLLNGKYVEHNTDGTIKLDASGNATLKANFEIDFTDDPKFLIDLVIDRIKSKDIDLTNTGNTRLLKRSFFKALNYANNGLDTGSAFFQNTKRFLNTHVATNNIFPFDPLSLSDDELAFALSGKENMKVLSEIYPSRNGNFNLDYENFEDYIKKEYKNNKSTFLSYLKQQFIDHPDTQIKNITSITTSVKDKIDTLFKTDISGATQYKTSQSDITSWLGLNNINDIDEIERKAKAYPELLKKGFKNEKENIDLRLNRVAYAKLKSYQASMNLNLTEVDFDKENIDSTYTKIQETVFNQAITKDLDSLFQEYQSQNNKFHSLRKNVNKINGFKKDIASTTLGQVLNAGLSFVGGRFVKGSAMFALGPLGGLLAGTALSRGSARRFINKNALKDQSEEFKSGLHFSEAMRDITGEDSLLNNTTKNEHLGLLEQELVKIQTKLPSLDLLSASNKDLATARTLLDNALKDRSFPAIEVKKLTLNLHKEISKAVSDFYAKELEKVLGQIEKQHSQKWKKRAEEILFAAGLSAAVTAVGWGIGYIWENGLPEFFKSADAAEKSKDAAEAAKKVAKESAGAVNDTTPTPKPSGGSGKPDISGLVQGRTITGGTPDQIAPSVTADNSETIKQAKLKANNVFSNARDTIQSILESSKSSFIVPDTGKWDTNLTEILRAATQDTKHPLSVKEAYNLARMFDVPSGDVNKIYDGEILKVPAKVLSKIPDADFSNLAEKISNLRKR